MNKLKEGQIYTLNDGETYDVIHRHFEDGSGSWCYEIVVMKEVIYDGTVTWSKDMLGYSIEWEDYAIDEIRKNGVLVGQLGETHFFNKANGYKLEEIKKQTGGDL
jgi:hypothetical protein